MEISVAMEAAMNDVNQFQNQMEVLYQKSSSSSATESRLSATQSGSVSGLSKKKWEFKSQQCSGVSNRTVVVCYCFGSKDHIKAECKYNNALCNLWKRTGHLKEA